MVQFKNVFLGSEEPPTATRRATTAQKCVRAGGKHNDLEQVGHTARHHTFFEMLGNFSFGDYFKRDAIALRVGVRHRRARTRSPSIFASRCITPTTKRARSGGRSPAFPTTASTAWATRTTSGRWPTRARAGRARRSTSTSRTWRVTGVRRRARRASGPSSIARSSRTDAFVEGCGSGPLPRDLESRVHAVRPSAGRHARRRLPKPSVDTGAGLERIAAVMQGVTNNFHTDLFAPLIAAVESWQSYGSRGANRTAESRRTQRHPRAIRASFRVLADHARAVAFLLADGVFPSNEGRGYVLRRILRRAVRHAWLLGRREPTLVAVVQRRDRHDGATCIRSCSTRREAHPRHDARRGRAVSRDDRGRPARFDQLAPTQTTQGRGTITR